jgi:hypothetical protein
MTLLDSDEKGDAGKLERENKYQGTRSFEKKRALLFGFITVKFSPGKGTWFI